MRVWIELDEVPGKINKREVLKCEFLLRDAELHLQAEMTSMLSMQKTLRLTGIIVEESKEIKMLPQPKTERPAIGIEKKAWAQLKDSTLKKIIKKVTKRRK